MTSFISGRDLKQDILFRGGENVLGVSGWDSKVLDYLNRAYRGLANGASEFLPEFIEDWWWMRRHDVIELRPVFKDGTVGVTMGSTGITLSQPPGYDLTGYRLRVNNQPDIFTISSHTSGAGNAVLDMVYTGPTDAAVAFDAMKVSYTLSAGVVSMISPVMSYRGSDILGMSPERMDTLYALRRLGPGMPSTFCIENERQIRFNAGGMDDGTSVRLEFHYRPSVVDITDGIDSIPLVPEQYRHLLADMALTFLLTDKNDDRAVAAAGSAKSGLIAMVRENRKRLEKMDSELGTIRPRRGGQPLKDRRPGNGYTAYDYRGY